MLLLLLLLCCCCCAAAAVQLRVDQLLVATRKLVERLVVENTLGEGGGVAHAHNTHTSAILTVHTLTIHTFTVYDPMIPFGMACAYAYDVLVHVLRCLCVCVLL